MSLAMPPGDGDALGEAGDGDDPVTDEMAEEIGEVTDDRGDDSAGAGPTPPAGINHSHESLTNYICIACAKAVARYRALHY